LTNKKPFNITDLTEMLKLEMGNNYSAPFWDYINIYHHKKWWARFDIYEGPVELLKFFYCCAYPNRLVYEVKIPIKINNESLNVFESWFRINENELIYYLGDDCHENQKWICQQQ
jgi:hypothetical protein